jgi:hypothetical protein
MTKETPSVGMSRFEPLSVLWRVLVAPQTLLVLMGSTALALALGTLIPQIPPQVSADPQAWLAVQTGFFGQRNGLVRALGLFDVYHAFWFRLLLVLTGLTLFAWTVESADLAWRGMGRTSWTADTFAFWARPASRVHLSFSLPLDDVHARLRDVLTRHGFRWADVPGLPAPNLVAGRRELTLWARPLFFGALVAALVGLAIAGNWGWQSKDWFPVLGDSRAVGRSSPQTLRLDAFDLQLGSDGRLRDYRSEITWLEGEAVAGRDVVGVGQPARRRGVTVRQVGYVPIVKMRGWDSGGRPLTFQVMGEEAGMMGEVEVVFASADAQPHVLIPRYGLFLVLTFEPQSAQGHPVLRLALLREDGVERQLLALLYESGSVAFDDMRVDVDLAYGPIMRTDYRPAMGLVVVGMVLAVVALAVWCLVPSQLVWLALMPGDGDSSLIQILVPAGMRGSLWLPELATRLREGLVDAS